MVFVPGNTSICQATPSRLFRLHELRPHSAYGRPIPILLIGCLLFGVRFDVPADQVGGHPIPSPAHRVPVLSPFPGPELAAEPWELLEGPARGDALQDPDHPGDGVLGREFEEQVDTILFDRQLLDPEPELLGDRLKPLAHARPRLRIAERSASFRTPDQVVLAVVICVAARPPGHAGILPWIRTATKGEGRSASPPRMFSESCWFFSFGTFILGRLCIPWYETRPGAGCGKTARPV